ncbi:branched-chain amino acid transaminase [Streptomyces griseoluteus]|uniref:branched-chain amino acid transaminase n=1 Tax=Streptomyces griseoluteus TaxID=29306 RepID=UPI00142EEA09|nr:branched-chain amino acid transaminase [Streptomyces griseoluteus]GHF30982.1 branched chain amino acid aminotransferase [Streptomyces griseoluteus]
MNATTGERWVFHQGEFARARDVTLGPGTQGLHYGTGVFEGIRSYAAADGDEALLFKAKEHYERLHASCRLLRLDLPYSPDELVEVSRELVRRNGLTGDAYLRPLVYKLALEPGTPFGVRLSGVSTSVTILAMPMGDYSRAEGIRCAVSSWRRVPDASLPARAKITGAYANNALAVDEATAAGYDDAIMLNQGGSVAEASTANVFVVRSGEVATPGPDSDILLGLTRAAVMRIIADETGVSVTERAVPRSELHTADEVFLTGTGCQIVPVTEIDGRPVGDGTPGPLTTRVREVYRRAVRGADPRYRHWTTSVGLGSRADARV